MWWAGKNSNTHTCYPPCITPPVAAGRERPHSSYTKGDNTQHPHPHLATPPIRERGPNSSHNRRNVGEGVSIIIKCTHLLKCLRIWKRPSLAGQVAGVAGFEPIPGRVLRYGLFSPYGPPLDKVCHIHQVRTPEG